MSQAGPVTCPICFNVATQDGNHRLCALPCGHMFGYMCLEQWLELKCECPMCRTQYGIDDVVVLHWESPAGASTTTQVLEEELEQHLHEKQAMAHELESMKVELARTRCEMVEMIQQEPPRQQFTFRSRMPALLMEAPVSRGRRLCVVDSSVLACCSWERRGERRHGVQIFAGGSAQPVAMELHAVPLWDVAQRPNDKQKIATVATDKAVVLSDFSVRERVSSLATADPLFCCDWMSANVVVAGGAKGSLYFYDPRADNEVTHASLGAGTFTGVAALNNHRVFAVASDTGRVFDMRNSMFEDAARGTSGGLHVRHCHKVGLSFVATSGTVSFLKYCEGDGLVATTVLSAHGTARPMLSVFDREAFAVYATEPKSFALVRMRRVDLDIWSKWRHHFQTPDHPSPIVDLAMAKEGSHVNVFSLSSELLRITSIPVC